MLTLPLLLSTAFADPGDSSKGSEDDAYNTCYADKSGTTCDDDTTDEPTLVLDGTSKGSVEIGKGEVVWLTGEVTQDVMVDGGVLVIDGGTVGRDLTVLDGELDLVDAEVGRDLDVEGGKVTVGDASVGRDFVLVGTASISEDGYTIASEPGQGIKKSGRLFVDRDISIDAEISITIQGDLIAGRNIDLNAGGDLSINGTVDAGGDISLSTGPGGSASAPDAAFISSASGMVNLFNSNAARLGGTIVGPQGVVITSEAELTMSGTVDWGRKGYSESYDGEDYSCSTITYYPTESKPRVDFYQCL